jgi:hypothetical protein
MVPCGRSDRRTGMTKLIFAFLLFPNAPKKGRLASSRLLVLLHVCANFLPSTWNNSVPTECLMMKSDIAVFFENL